MRRGKGARGESSKGKGAISLSDMGEHLFTSHKCPETVLTPPPDLQQFRPPIHQVPGDSLCPQDFVSQPEDVKADLVPLHQFIVGERLKPLGLFPNMAVVGVVAGDEIVEVAVAHRILFQRESQVGSEVVYPQFLRPRGFAGGFAIEEQHVCLDALRIKDARRESEQRMGIAFMQQLLADGLTRSAFKQDVIRYDNRSPAVDFQNRFDVLKEVELLVRGGRPKILPFIDERVFTRTRLFHPQL